MSYDFSTLVGPPKSYTISFGEPPKSFSFNYRWDDPGIEYRLCAHVLTKIARAIIFDPKPYLTNSPESELKKLFRQLNRRTARMWEVKISLTHQEFSNLIALFPYFKIKGLNEFNPRVDYYYPPTKGENFDGVSNHFTAHQMMTEGWFAGEAGVILQIHTDLLNVLYRNCSKIQGKSSASRRLMRYHHYRPYSRSEPTIMQ